MTQDELIGKLAALGQVEEAQKKAVACALVGHSKIQTHFWGYFCCARCGEQVGDSLGGAYKPTDVVIVGHDCATCHTNYDALKWQDKFLVADPFVKEAV